MELVLFFFKLQSSCLNTIYLQAVIFPVMLEESYFYHNQNFHLYLSLLGEFLFSLICLSVHALSSTIPRTNIKDMGKNQPWNWRLTVLKTKKRRQWHGTPLQHSCLENPVDGGAWWAEVHGLTKSWTQLSDFTLTFHFHALEKEMATYSSILAWGIPGTGEPRGLPSLGSHRVGHD